MKRKNKKPKGNAKQEKTWKQKALHVAAGLTNDELAEPVSPPWTKKAKKTKESKTEEEAVRPPIRSWLVIATCSGALGLGILQLLAMSLRIITHSDLWWAMAAGRHITQNGTVPTQDVFSYTFLDKPWINMEWLTQVLYYNLYESFGENIIFFGKMGFIFLLFAIGFCLCWDRTKNLLISLLVTAFGALVSELFLDARPQLFTFLYSLLFLVILHLYRRHNRNLLFLLPVIMLLWVNQHYGYIFGMLVLIGNVGAEILKTYMNRGLTSLRVPAAAPALPMRKIGVLALFTVISFGAVLVNPWGFEGVTHPIEMSKFVSDDTAFLTILEWQPPRLFSSAKFSPFWFGPFLFILIGFMIVGTMISWKSFDLNDVGLSLVLAFFFAMQHRRFIPLFAMLSLPLFAFYVKMVCDWLVWKKNLIRLREPAMAVVGLSCWIGLFLGLWVRVPHWNENYREKYKHLSLFRTNIQYEFFPAEAIKFIKESGLKGPMYNLYNWGGYLMYELPEEKVFTDGRAQTVYTEEFYKLNLNIHHGQDGWKQLLNQYGIKFALISMGDTNTALRLAFQSAPDWKWVFAHRYAAIFVKICPENQDFLARYKRRELPLPESGLTYYLYGRDAMVANDQEQSIKDFRRAAELEPDREELQRSYVLSLAQGEFYEEAILVCEQSIARFPESMDLQVEKGRLLALIGKNLEAYAQLKKVFLSAPEKLTAVDLMLQTNPQEGARFIESTYQKNRNNMKVVMAMGRVLELAGQLAESERLYFEVVKESQFNDRALANYCGRRLQGVQRKIKAKQAKP